MRQTAEKRQPSSCSGDVRLGAGGRKGALQTGTNQFATGLAIKKALKELMAEHTRKDSFGAVDAWEYNVVVALDGWDESEGARLEVAIATACGIPVMTLSEFLEDKEA